MPSFEYRLSSNNPNKGLDFKALLNDEQWAAVTSPPGKTLVIAGAGAGKTRTLTHRVAWLLEQNVAPYHILLLTFTNKAAKEMLERVRTLVGGDVSEMWAGTFHSIGNRLLRRHGERLGIAKGFSILDRDDQKVILKQICAEMPEIKEEKGFPKPDVLLGIFSLSINRSEPLMETLEMRYPYLLKFQDMIQKIHLGYQERKKANQSLDFDDLLAKTVSLLETEPHVLELCRKKFKHVLVDEYQDTNGLQGRMIDLIVGEDNALLAVGDDAQAIYSWRGAEMKQMLDFPIRYPEAKVMMIETNYRSVPEVLALSNAAISMNTERFAKDLRSIRDSLGQKPIIVPVDDPRQQAAFVAQRVRECMEQGISAKEIAVLYRAHHLSLELQMELTRGGVGFSITSGLRFFEQAHMKDIAAFLRVVSNPADEVSFKRMVMLLPSCGPSTADKLWKLWQHSTWSKGGASVSELLAWKIPSKMKEAWSQCAFTLGELKTIDGLAKPAEMIYSIMEGVYDEYIKLTFDHYESRKQDVLKLMEFASGFDEIEEFLSQLSLLSAVDGDPQAEEKNQASLSMGQVTLSTIHQAKGLEWTVVFVVWLTDGQFPNNRVLDDFDPSALEEERRLFYVAVTRAKDQLYLSYPMFNPKSYTGEIYCTPSRFLDELPSELSDSWHISAH